MTGLIQRTMALAASIIVLAACSPAAGQSTEPTDAPEENRPPTFSLIPAEGSAVPGQAGSWCWDGECVDLVAQPTVTDYLFIPHNLLMIQSEPPSPNSYTLTLLSGDANGEVAASTEITPDGDMIEWTPAVPGGNYVLVVQGTWSDTSNVTYTFGVSLPGQVVEVPPTGEAMEGPPDLVLVLPDGSEHIADLGTYCWIALCVDTMWPPPLTNPIPFTPGAPISLRFSNTPARTLNIQLFDVAVVESQPGFPQESVAATDLEVSADGSASWMPDGLVAGRYLLVIFANWRGEGENTIQEGGDASYSFVLDVQ